VTLIAGPAVNCGESNLADRDWMCERGNRFIANLQDMQSPTELRPPHKG